MPCGNTNMPPPKLLSSFPDASNFRIDGRLDPAHELAPQRSATHRPPSRSISTALVDPHILLSGSLNQFSTVRYGLGKSACAYPIATPARPAMTVSILAFILQLHPPMQACNSGDSI